MSSVPDEFFSDLFFNNMESQSLMPDNFDGLTMSHLLDSSPNSASRLQLPLLMGDEDDYDLMMAELVSAEEAPKPIRASTESIEKLEKVRIEGSEGLVCTICLDEFSIGSEAKRLPCCHVYHENCIVEWLNNSNMCPLCSDWLEKVRIEGSEGLIYSVCLDEFSIGSEAKRLSCSHVYHENCIVEWINNSNMCPLCSFVLPPLSHRINGFVENSMGFRQNSRKVIF